MSLNDPPHRPTDDERTQAREIERQLEGASWKTFVAAGGRAMCARQYDQALALLKLAALCQPDHPWVYEAFGAVYRSMGKVAESALCYRAAVDLDPSSLRAHLHLGELAFAANDLETARSHLSRVTALDQPQGSFQERARITLERIEA